MFFNFFVIVFTLILSKGSCQGGRQCPEKIGRFADAKQCDAYLECDNGIGTEKLCPDGLLFNPKASIFSYPCQYPIEVDCEGRSATQSPRSTEECPHSYGYFKVSADESKCGQFYNCVEGKGFLFDCPEGLAFNEETFQCDWPDQVKSCNAEAFLGFTCPEETGAFSASGFRAYRSPYDCKKFFICVNGRPRLMSCGEGQGFDDETASCVDAQLAPNCIFEVGQEPSFSPPNNKIRQ